MYDTEARKEWDSAHRHAEWKKFKAALLGRDTHLLDFNTVAHRMHLLTPIYRGIQEIPVDCIIGSVGRSKDFLVGFLPISHELEDRWQKIAAQWLDPYGPGLPPIEVFKVGNSYFVKDGNHRVSVARHLDVLEIDAHVWEYDGEFDPEIIDTMRLRTQEFRALHMAES